jgi:MFS family permease
MNDKENIVDRTASGLITRDFLLAFFALFAFIVNHHALYPTLPIYLKELGSNTREIGILVGIFGVSSLFARLLAGGALGKYHEKKVMMFGALLFVLTFVALMVFRPFWPLFAVRLFQGVAFACLDTAALSFVVRITPLTRRGQAIGYFTLAPILTTAIAPLGAMFLINRYSFTTLFSICIILSFFSFFFVWRLKGENVVTSDTGASGSNDIFLNRKVIAPSMISFMKNFVYGGVIAFFPLYAIQCGVKNPGYFFTASAVMLIAGRIIGGKIVDTCDKRKIIPIMIFSGTVAMIVLSFSKSLFCLSLWNDLGSRKRVLFSRGNGICA